MPTREAPFRAAAASRRRSLRDLWTMARVVSGASLDVLFFPTVYTYFPVRTNAKVIVGIHDVIAEDFPTEVFPQPFRRLLWSLKSRLARRRADYLLTVSEHAREGLLRVFRPPERTLWVVGESADPIFQPLARPDIDRNLLARHGLELGDRALVYLGGFNPHKNLETLVRSMAVLHGTKGLEALKLILIGDVDDEIFTPGLEALKQCIARHGLGESVVFTGYLDDQETRHLLAFSRALVLPSLAEGFGLPAVEAAACGTPVVATENSPLPEILEGGGLFVDPRDGAALTRALERVLRDDDLRARLGRQALGRARALSWSHSASQFQALLSKIREGGR